MSLRLVVQEERSTELQQKLACARFELLDEYLQSHNHPWIVGYSGGKDSTLVVQLVFEMLLLLAPSERRRSIHIVANDTLVESPLVISHIHRSFQYFSDAAEAFQLPVTVRKLTGVQQGSARRVARKAFATSGSPISRPPASGRSEPRQQR